MKVNIYGREGNEELVIMSVPIEYADTGATDIIAITLKRGMPVNPELVIGALANFGGMAFDVWHKYDQTALTKEAININLPKSSFWIEVRE